MPAVTSGRVLITGVNSFTGMAVAKHLLELGYSVRGTVRSEAKAGQPRTFFNSYGGKFEAVVVEDLTVDGAFDSAVKDVDAIVNASAPFHLKADHPDEMIVPAVKGFTSLLNSVLKYGPKVRRVIQISSISAIQNQHEPNKTVYDETIWNDNSVEECKKLGRNAAPTDKYEASKTLSERAGWEFIEKHKEEVKFDMVSLNPGLILGPGYQDAHSPEELNTSLQLFYVAVLKNQFAGEAALKPGVTWVDLRDVVKAHINALQVPEAGGERFLLSCEQFTWQEWINVMRKIDPSIPEGNTTWRPSDSVYNIYFDVRKSREILGIRYYNWEECGRTVLDYYREKGWWGKN